MKLRLPLVLFALTLGSTLITPLVARAQVGLYLNPIATRVSNSTLDTGDFSFLGPTTKSHFFAGVDIGGYYNFTHTPGLDIGLDVRDSIVHGNNALLNSFLLGPRVAAHPFSFPLKPYVQGAVGIGTTRSAHNNAHVSKGEYGIFVGADYTLSKHVDFRVLEVGYGSVTTISSDTIGGTATIPASNLFSVSSGLVFRLP